MGTTRDSSNYFSSMSGMASNLNPYAAVYAQNMMSSAWNSYGMATLAQGLARQGVPYGRKINDTIMKLLRCPLQILRWVIISGRCGNVLTAAQCPPHFGGGTEQVKYFLKALGRNSFQNINILKANLES